MLAARRAAAHLEGLLTDRSGFAAHRAALGVIGPPARTLGVAAQHAEECGDRLSWFESLPGFAARGTAWDSAGTNFAEREGFEPSVPFRIHMISNHAPSATRSPLRASSIPFLRAPRGWRREWESNPRYPCGYT